jgi:hypothetical protein
MATAGNTLVYLAICSLVSELQSKFRYTIFNAMVKAFPGSRKAYHR